MPPISLFYHTIFVFTKFFYENSLLFIFVFFLKYRGMPKPLLEILAENVKYYRAKTGLSQLKFAIQLNISPSYLNDIENGRQYASLKMIERLANEFKIEPYQLLLPKDISVQDVNLAEYENELRALKEQVVELFNKHLEK